MAITARNFCHVEEMEGGAKVLFYVEHDGDNIILHQVTAANIGTVDIELSMPAEQWEAVWPDKVRFAYAAAQVVTSIRELGLEFAT
ncbi:hypothetical protein [Mesorhizobium sp. M0959]|uniref:hypothetical protein n=1 Tax=unclassified Mesorhizobium TaxID=325217 RepID=UPI003335CD12